MGKQILVADDDRFIQRIISGILTENGYEVTCVNSGHEAITILSDRKFDCVLLDFYMPGRDGLDVICSMFGRGDRTPVIIVSAGLSDYYEAAVQGFGIVRKIMKKPFRAEEIVSAVESIAGKADS